jgi:hypothetical protein
MMDTRCITIGISLIVATLQTASDSFLQRPNTSLGATAPNAHTAAPAKQQYIRTQAIARALANLLLLGLLFLVQHVP